MPTGLRVTASAADLDGFLAFIATRGAVQIPACEKSGELVRFTIGRHIGRVSRRKSGALTFSGIARTEYEQMIEARRSAAA